MGQKLDIRAFCSEIYMKIELFSRLEQNYTSAPIAQLAARLTFFIWFWPDQSWPERVGVQFPVEEHDFFSSFKLFFLIIFCMHLYHILINWSQKFWVVYVEYRFIYEQCGGPLAPSVFEKQCSSSKGLEAFPVLFFFREEKAIFWAFKLKFKATS